MALTSFDLRVAGTPIPKGRPRSRVVQAPGRKPFVQVYTDAATKHWEEEVAFQVRQQLQGGLVPLPLDDRVMLVLRFNLPRPKSLPKAVVYPVRSRADVDNLAKAILDALQNADVLSDDRIITDCTIMKRYASDTHPEGVEITVDALVPAVPTPVQTSAATA